MQKLSRCLIATAAVVLGSGAASAAAQDLRLSMTDGRVTLVAHDVPVQKILAEWARVGDTRIVNAAKLAGPPLTLELVDCPEGKALDLLLRQAAGYLAALRPAGQPGVSVYDRILILPTSKPPVLNTTAATPPFNRNLMPQPVLVQPVDDDEGDPRDQGPTPAPGIVPHGMPVPGPQPFPGAATQGTQEQPVLTAPRPGQLPQSQGISPTSGGRPLVVPMGRPGGS